jgi:hypothetical protein
MTLPTNFRARIRRGLIRCNIAAILSLAGLVSGIELPEHIRLTSGWELQPASKVADDGGAISRAGYRPSGWYSATVPGTVLTSLVNDQVYPEPLYGENNRPDKIPETLCRTSYWYRTTFNVPRTFQGRHVWLTFKGINYTAEVYVNGTAVGNIEGAFVRGIFDVTTNVTLSAPNALAVHVHPQPHPGATHEKTVTTGTGPNGGVTGLDGPTFLCSIGWDWIPTIRDRNTGIWQDVMLSASGPVVVQDPYVTSEIPLPRTDTADLTVQTTLRNVSDSIQKGTLTGVIDGTTFKQNFSLAPHETRNLTLTPAKIRALRLRNPRLWWPNGYGPQNLYTLHLSFSVKGAVSDERNVTFGVRKITYTLPGSDNLALSVNGVPVIAKGGDWGMDEAMKRIPRKRLEAMVRTHQIANYTIIRNWVGQSTSEDLYDLCDQYGILLWDEFFEPHPADGPIPENLRLYLSNVREKILRFRSHPSVALWCARNEGDPPKPIGEGIQKLINELDPGRLYQPSSTAGRGVNSGGPYHWRTPREFYTYTEAFKTEVGSMSVPTLEAIKAMMPPKDWEVINDDWAQHDFCAGAQEGDHYPEIISSRYGPPANLADFARKAQLANYECFRAMYEGRFAKLFKPQTGVITWMSSPAQPSFVWQLYSHDLEPNSSLFATRKACEPVHVQMNQNDWHIMVINNKPQSLAGLSVRTTIYNLDGTLQYSQTNSLTASPSAATDAGMAGFPPGVSPIHFVKLQLWDAQSRLLSENFYWRATPEHEDDFQSLNDMPRADIEIEGYRRESAGNCLLNVEIRNPSRAVALMTHLQLRKGRSGARVLPVFYSDNYISLVPGERKMVTIEAALADLGGESPVLAVDGWNVALVPVPADGNKVVRVIPNMEAHTPTQKEKAAPESISLNCGGNPLGLFRFGLPALDVFGRDRDFKGGNSASTTESVETGVSNAAPAAVYQSERYGKFTYTLPVKRGQVFTVRLHFAEIKLDAGQRKFNVDINGNRVLTDFDIAAEAGKNKALVKDFPGIPADADGHIVLAFNPGAADQPKVCGIQIIR